MSEHEKKALLNAIAYQNEEQRSDMDDHSVDLEAPGLQNQGRTVPYSPSKEHMSATIESHGTTVE